MNWRWIIYGSRSRGIWYYYTILCVNCSLYLGITDFITFFLSEQNHNWSCYRDWFNELPILGLICLLIVFILHPHFSLFRSGWSIYEKPDINTLWLSIAAGASCLGPADRSGCLPIGGSCFQAFSFSLWGSCVGSWVPNIWNDSQTTHIITPRAER